MIELKHNSLAFAFPEVHPHATLRIEFQRTLRIPDDNDDYPLPPGLGRFPLRHVDDFADGVPGRWLEHGGVMMPMYQSEAMWLNFTPEPVPGHGSPYPFAIKVAAGKINAVTGDAWRDRLHARPQDYVVAPEQPWLDGYCVRKGIVRQFVAMPLGSGYSAEEQLTGEADHGGLQIVAYPMKRNVFERRFPRAPRRYRFRTIFDDGPMPCKMAAPDMGLAPGGRMRQEVYDDRFGIGDWDERHGSRCFVHIANSLVWRAMTGDHPPSVPPTAREYENAGLPWFEYYGGDAAALDGAGKLGGLKGVAEMAKDKGDTPLPENESVTPENVVELQRGWAKDQVREGTF